MVKNHVDLQSEWPYILNIKMMIRNKIFAYTSIIGLLLIVGCGNNEIIPEKDMVMILKKIYLTDGILSSVEMKPLSGKDSIEYYEPIIESLGYTRSQFDSSIKYYSQRTEKFDEILDRVIIELSKMELKQDDIKEKLDSSGNQIVDTALNLWPYKTYWDMATDHTLNSSLGFEIPIVGTGEYVLSFDAQLFSDDESEDTRAYVFFFFDDKTPVGGRSNPIFTKYLKDDNEHSYSDTLILTDSKVTHFKGWLYDHGGERKDLKRHAVFSNIKVTYKPQVVKDSIEFLKPRNIRKVKNPKSIKMPQIVKK